MNNATVSAELRIPRLIELRAPVGRWNFVWKMVGGGESSIWSDIFFSIELLQSFFMFLEDVSIVPKFAHFYSFIYN